MISLTIFDNYNSALLLLLPKAPMPLHPLIQGALLLLPAVLQAVKLLLPTLENRYSCWIIFSLSHG